MMQNQIIEIEEQGNNTIQIKTNNIAAKTQLQIQQRTNGTITREIE